MRNEPLDPEVRTMQLVGGHSVTPSEHARWLIWKAQQFPGNVLEIGTHRGEMAREFAALYPERRVWTVDWPDNNVLDPAQRAEVLKAEHVGVHCRYMPNVNQLMLNSRDLDYNQMPGLSFVYIDGDHGYEGVKADTEAVLAYFEKSPKAVHPACVVWHDFSSNVEGVWRYLNSRLDLDIIRVDPFPMAYLEIE